MSTTRPLLVFLMVALAGPPARAQDEGEVLLAGFEDAAELTAVTATGGALALERGRAPEGEGWLVATAAPPGGVVAVRFAAADLARHDGLAFHVRARLADGARPARLRLRALDAQGVELFQRRLSDALRGWSQRREPFAHWRWGDRVGRWADVRALEVEATGAVALELDHVRLLPGARGERSALPDPAWLAQLASPGDAAPWTHDVGPFRLVGPPALAPALSSPAGALERAAARLTPLAAWLDRVAPEALRPIDDGPVVVAILPDAAAYGAFFARLGAAWRVVIAPPRGAGYAVQDLCAIVHDTAQGLDRPVIAHEATHALVARRLRLVPGDPRHAWLQEGLANYIQLCLHPESFELRAWRRAFIAGVKDDGLFRPLRAVVDGGVSPERYAQLASLVGFLLAERPGWVGALARGLADREPVADVLARLGSSLEQLEADWVAWGRATYGTPAAIEAGRHFPLPREWAE